MWSGADLWFFINARNALCSDKAVWAAPGGPDDLQGLHVIQRLRSVNLEGRARMGRGIDIGGCDGRDGVAVGWVEDEDEEGPTVCHMPYAVCLVSVPVLVSRE